MEEKIDFSRIDKPFVIRCDRLNSWPCFGWTLNDWSEKCNQTKFAFRVHKRDTNILWENQAIDRFDTHLKDFIEWTQLDANCCDTKNPFRKYPKKEFWVYSSYNYMEKLFDKNSQIMESVKWSQLGLDSKLESNATNSTLWIGSEGAFTPCHQDSYGYNFVAQLSGKKLWILFPPSDRKYLYPTRIPYEESSVFSSINFEFPDFESHPLFRETNPHTIELKAGEVLFVPHLWWHFVKVIEEDSQKSCISINNWIFNESFQSSLNESIVRFLSTALFNTYCPSEPNKWLNSGADLFTPEEAINSVGLILRKCNSMNEMNESNVLEKQIIPSNSRFIDSSTFEEMEKLFKRNNNKKLKSNPQIRTKNFDISSESIVKCILDPDVIELIAQKLKSIETLDSVSD